jgi:hypothetical protein
MAQSDGNASGGVKAVIWLKENFDKPFSIKLIARDLCTGHLWIHQHITSFNASGVPICQSHQLPTCDAEEL